MKHIFLFATIFAVFGAVLSSVSLYPAVLDKPGHCWSELTGPMDEKEDRQIPNKCMLASCTENKVIRVVTCGIAQGPNGASKTDYSKPYPKCCPRPI